MLTPRQKILLDYFLDVTRDLVRRGQLKKRTGQSFVDLFKSETRVVLTEMSEDVFTVLRELGVGLVGGLEVIARKQVDNVISGGMKILSELLSGNRR